jgi:hypothetical protein
MKFAHDLTYDAPPAAVLEMLADPAFREKVCEAVQGRDRDVSITGAGAGMTVRVDQTQPARGIPSFATKFVGDQIQIIQHESWRTPTSATLELEIPGKPGAFAGTIALVAAGAGTTETVSGEVKVKVPLIGGRLESLVGDLLRSALKAENRVGRAWLAGDR